MHLQTLGIIRIFGSLKLVAYRFSCRAQTAALSSPKCYGGYALSPSLGLVIAGGASPTTADVLVTPDGAAIDAQTVPDLPEDNYYQCVAAVDENTLVAVGGFLGSRRQAYRFTAGSSAWETLPDMLEKRAGMGCGVVVGGGRYVMVAGGEVDGEQLDSTEMLDLTTMTWTSGSKIYLTI